MPFDSPHGEFVPGGSLVNVPATGYMVQTRGGVFLFPGDARTFDPTFLERFTGISAVFAHVFLGRSAALVATPPLLDAFIAFYLASRPGRVVLSHLYELARDPADCWRVAHAKMIAQAFAVADRHEGQTSYCLAGMILCGHGYLTWRLKLFQDRSSEGIRGSSCKEHISEGSSQSGGNRQGSAGNDPATTA